MDDIKMAAKRRFEQALKGSNWDAHVQGTASNPVALWLYSVNPVQGVRVISQMSVEGYRAACDRAAIPSMPGNEPWDVLGEVLDEHDKLEDFTARVSMTDDLVTSLVLYACKTKTWAALPLPHQTPGIHLVICDWTTKAGVRIFRPGAVITRSVLSQELLAETLIQALAMHLAKNPTEMPVLG